MIDRDEQAILCNRFLVMAKREMGTRETPGSVNTARIQEYRTARTVKARWWQIPDEVAWCSDFVGFVMLQAEWTGTGSPKARSYLKWGQATSTPVLWCVCVFSRPPIPTQGHVGFYVGEDATHVLVLGGNQDNAVKIKRYPKTRLLGYRLPQTPPALAVA